MSLFLALLIAAQEIPNAPSPEIRAVQDRARREAEEKKAVANKTLGPPVPAQYAEKFYDCIAASAADTARGLIYASEWLTKGGSFYARQCQGFALSRQGRWVAAEVAFGQAGEEADKTRDPAAGRLWAQAGNAALAAGEFAKARSHFDAAIVRGLPDGTQRGATYLDRARASMGMGDTAAARIDLDRAMAEAPADALAWLLSATLARRTGDLALADKHILEAARLSPDDPAVALEQGNIAVMSGRDDAAKSAWNRAVKLAGDGDAGKTAAANLAELANAPPPTPAPAKP